jgi:NAD(P)H-dependent FMN reductase
MTVISVIVGSTREGRFSEKAREVDFATPEEARGCRRSASRSSRLSDAVFRSASNAGDAGSPEVVQRWTAAIAQSDGFAFVTPEYNYGPSAVLKNAIDWVYPEWKRKAAGFVSYDSAMGARSVQQLRETAIELQLAPIRSSVHPCRHPVVSLPRRRCRRWTGRTGRACRDADRRSAVVDRSPEDGAHQRVLTATAASVRLPVSVTAMKYRRCRSSMVLQCLRGMPAYKVFFNSATSP